MTRIVILWFLFYLCFQFCSSDDFGKSKVFIIGFLIEESQHHIRNDISITLNKIEEDTNQKLEAEYVTIYRDEPIDTMNNLCKVLHNGVSIIVDMTYAAYNTAVDIINSVEIPYLKVSITIEPFLRGMEKYLHARTNAVEVVFIFQNQQEFNDALLYVVKGLPFRTMLLNGLNESFAEHFEQIHTIPSYYVIFANTINMNEIFQKMFDKDLFYLPNKWHLCFMDFESNKFEHHNKVLSATKIAPNFNITCPLKNDDQCDHGNDVSLPKIMLEEVISTIISNSKNLPHKSSGCVNNNAFSNKSFSLQNNNLRSEIEMNPLLQFTNEEVSFQLNLTMQIYTKRNTYDNTALWINNELQQLSDNIKPPRRFLRVGTAMAEPWSFIRRDSITNQPILDRKGKPIWTGYCVDLIEKLSKKMNFDYKLVIPKMGTVGKQLSNGKWDGLIGDLVDGETDMAVGAVKMTSDREEVVDFVTPYFEQTGISIVIRKPVRQASLFKFMTVLRLEVWFCIVGALISTAILIWLLEKYSPYSSRNNKKAYAYRCREFTIKESFWFALTSFTPQGGGEAPKSISGRILISAYWLFVVLMLATFTANLAAFLTVERMQTPVQSLDQLARQSRINYTVVNNSDTHKFFMNMKHAEDMLYKMWKELTLNSTDIFRYRIWDYPIKEQYGHMLIAINSSHPVKDAEEGFRKVNEHEGADYAFIHDSAEIKYEISRNCNLTEVGEVFAEQPYAIALPQGSTLHDEITYAILDFQKQRVFEDLLEKYWDRNKRKHCAQLDDNEGISLQSLGGIFIATIFGLTLAVISLFAEISFYRKQEKEGNLSALADSFNARHDNQRVSRRPRTILRKSEKTYDNTQQVTIGNRFVPQKRFQANISYISVQPRKPIHKFEYIE